jgi:GT2 family glycosyltransferase
VKIAVCIPSYRFPRIQFVQSYGPLLLHPTEHELKPYVQAKTPVSFNRNQIAGSALEWGADALLWIDDDQIFPADTLERLSAHNAPIVGCNIARRATPTEPTASRLDAAGLLVKVWTTPELAHAKAVQKVAHVGMGVCLIRREVFERVPQPWFIEATTPAGLFVTEDVFFMKKARGAGFEVLLDHALSWEIGHVFESPLWNLHALETQPSS